EGQSRHCRHLFLRVLVVDDSLDDELLRSRKRRIELGRTPLIFLGKQVDRPEQKDRRVGIGDFPQRWPCGLDRAGCGGCTQGQRESQRGEYAAQEQFQRQVRTSWNVRSHGGVGAASLTSTCPPNTCRGPTHPAKPRLD